MRCFSAAIIGPRKLANPFRFATKNKAEFHSVAIARDDKEPAMTRDELLVLIRQAAREKKTELDLSKKGITGLPPEIGLLTHLRTLNLYDNKLTQLPPEIGQLANLQKLHLYHNQLMHLPPQIARLAKLEYLDLGSNQLTRLPPEVGQLENLTDLFLFDNQLTQLPPEIGQLVNLQRLYLHINQLMEIPPQIGQLANLQSLLLDDNNLTRLPPQIGKLANLQGLGLSENHWTQVPPQVFQLNNLISLNLSDNELTEIPPQIGQLANLQKLLLDDNNLTRLPPQISQLTNLKKLGLSKNQLTQLTEQIGQLTNLQELNLTDNKLEQLPPEIGLLSILNELKLGCNPLTSPPPEIVKQGTKAILTYLRAQLQQGQKRLWVSKMVVVGVGGVGKTSLLRGLAGEELRKEPSTHGMEAHKPLLVPHPTHKDVTMKLFAWDFGGQQIYHATHQFFLTDKALFVIVWNARTEYTQGRLGYWLDAVKARAPNSPILIVATHVEDRPTIVPPLDEWKSAYNIVGYLEVSNKDGRGIPALRQKIAEVAAALPHMGAERPANWVSAANAVQKTFIKHKSDPTQSRDYCDLAELLEFLARHGVRGDEANVMLRWYHDIGGVLIYPDDPDLKDLVILNPWWVNQTISKVLDYADPSLDQGVLTRAHVDVIWDDLPKLVRPKILRLMERFDLAYRIPDTDSSLVVPRLPPNPPDYRAVWDAIRQKPGCKELALRYEFSHIPAGIPTWFIARSHRFSMNLHWRNGALFFRSKRQHLGLVRADPEQRQMELIVRGPMPQDFFAVLKDGLALTLARYPGLEIRQSVPCPGGKGQPCAGQFDLDALHLRLEKGKESIECHRCSADVSIPRLLFGWGAAGSERLGAASNDRLLQELLDTVNAGFQRQDAGFQRQEDNHGELVTLLQRQFLQVHQSVQGLAESHCPNVFTLRQLEQAKLKGIVTKKLELQLYCQAPGNWHPTVSGRYEFSRPADWLRPLAPYLSGLVKVLRYAVPVAGAVVDDETAAHIRATADLSSALLGNSREGLEDAPEADVPTHAGGVALRHLRRLLDELDVKQTWGGLKNVPTPEGHWLWLCEKCAAPYRC